MPQRIGSTFSVMGYQTLHFDIEPHCPAQLMTQYCLISILLSNSGLDSFPPSGTGLHAGSTARLNGLHGLAEYGPPKPLGGLQGSRRLNLSHTKRANRIPPPKHLTFSIPNMKCFDIPFGVSASLHGANHAYFPAKSSILSTGQDAHGHANPVQSRKLHAEFREHVHLILDAII